MTEDQLEQECLAWLADVGWQHRYGPDIAPDGDAPERDNYRQVLLLGRLRAAVAALNPTTRAPPANAFNASPREIRLPEGREALRSSPGASTSAFCEIFILVSFASG